MVLELGGHKLEHGDEGSVRDGASEVARNQIATVSFSFSHSICISKASLSVFPPWVSWAAARLPGGSQLKLIKSPDGSP